MNDDFMPECPNECGLMHPDYQNTGFTPPEGAPHYELEGYYCPICGRKMSLEDADELQRDQESEEYDEPIE